MYKDLSKHFFNAYQSFRVDSFTTRRFTSGQFHAIIDSMNLPETLCKVRVAGNSLEGRPIRLFSIGTGNISILLWSQMHGDESTATMAIADLLNFFKMYSGKEEVATLLNQVTLHFLPMLNPDGAERFQRRTAQNIDMNRDALALRTPEARILKELQQKLKPMFGFNLHDQELSTIGATHTLAEIALLAPAYNIAKEDNEVRLRAKYLNAMFAEIMQQFIPNAIAKYDDTFEPRAFGDNMQLWGTSTMLVESGHTLNDPEKWNIRKYNAVGILTSFFALANGAYKQANLDSYNTLPANGKKVYDVIIRNVFIEHTNSTTTPADIGIWYQVDTHVEETPILIDAGDLSTYFGLKEVDGKGQKVSSSLIKLGKPFDWEGMF